MELLIHAYLHNKIESDKDNSLILWYFYHHSIIKIHVDHINHRQCNLCIILNSDNILRTPRLIIITAIVVF